ncbi:myb protein [Anaeramoeba flamelloides]|uniref:Myb protein n=1 Tax=Anaeramoeba flamelloides TaxID=1746091 RepID=A0ABQ8XQ48_9EUKA|nr:myb protein [Anaeramoeba flamelloides]
MKNSNKSYKQLKKSIDTLIQNWNEIEVKKIKSVKGAWCEIEDEYLLNAIKNLGLDDWNYVGLLVPGRTSKQCRERWKNQLNPSISQKKFSKKERELLIEKQLEFGNRWTFLSQFFEGRTGNQLKNYWHSNIKRFEKTKNSETKLKTRKITKNIKVANIPKKKKKILKIPKLTISKQVQKQVQVQEERSEKKLNVRKRNYMETAQPGNQKRSQSSNRTVCKQKTNIPKKHSKSNSLDSLRKNESHLSQKERMKNPSFNKQIIIQDSFSSIIENNFLKQQFYENFIDLPLSIDEGAFNNLIREEYCDSFFFWENPNYSDVVFENNEFSLIN